jgi:hypothetical protein
MTSAVPSQTFALPRPAIRRKAVLFGLGTSATVIAMVAINVQKWDSVAALDLACILGLIWLIALTESWVMYWATGRNRRLHVGPEGLCLEQGPSRQLVPWNTITQVEIRSESGVEVGMYIYTANGRELELVEYEGLPELMSLVKAGIPATASVKHS